MSDRFVTIPANEIQYGMFVTELDKPWLSTPFLVQGFIVKQPEELKLLTELCNTVVIDVGKSERGLVSKVVRRPIGKSIQQTFSNSKLRPYEDTRSFEDELPDAKKIYGDYETAVAKIYGEYENSRKIDLKAANEAAGNIVGSIIRNPDACMLLQQMRRKGDYLYNHALGTSIWAATLARQIGLSRNEIKVVALGGLLCDIGKLNVSERVLAKPSDLDDQEFDMVKQHVNVDDEFKQEYPGLTDAILTIIKAHHERHDGSGYPLGMKGDDIPVFARIVGLADSYDAMTNHRAHAKAMPPYQASKELYELRDIKFQAEIVEEFIQATGIYPVGTLVELNTGEVGVVIAEYRTKRLRPKLLLLLDADKNLYSDVLYLDLSTKSEQEYAIKLSLESGAYGLDPDDFFQ